MSKLATRRHGPNSWFGIEVEARAVRVSPHGVFGEQGLEMTAEGSDLSYQCHWGKVG